MKANNNNITNLTEAVPAPSLPLDTKPSVPVPTKPQATETPTTKPSQQWNTKNLGARFGADAVSAACAASMIAPVISIIDRSIMENTSGRSTLGRSLRTSLRTLLAHPRGFLISRPVALIFMLYGGTYLTANTLDTLSSTVLRKPAPHVSSGTAKFAASSSANVGLCIYKDQVYARLYGPPAGTGGPPRPVALPTYALFALRDCLTIFASFNIPPLLGPAISARLGAEMRARVHGETVAQFAAPAAVQVLSTPVHLLGLDVYNRPPTGRGVAITWADRWALVRKNWLVSCAARVCRIVPAFGLGGTVNTKVRRNLMERLV